MEKRADPKCTTIPRSFFTKFVLFCMTHCPPLHCVENTSHYTWGKPLIRMFLEIQCLSIVFIVLSHIWILVVYGEEMETVITNGMDITLPMMYLVAVIMGSVGYMRPTYWRVSMALLAYMLCLYFSIAESMLELEMLMTPAFAEFLQNDPTNAKIWVPWAIGFAFHVNISVTSLVLVWISIRDMYHFDPILKIPQNVPMVCSTIELSKMPSGQVVHGTIYRIREDDPLFTILDRYPVSSSVV